jgi:hypothetical protein
MALKVHTGVKTSLPPFSKRIRRNEFGGAVVWIHHLKEHIFYIINGVA